MIEFPLATTVQAAHPANQPPQAPQDAALFDLAKKFEATFLTEMLRHTGLGKSPEGFDGGAGEARFSGFLVEAYAEQLSDSGQIGLADQIYSDLVARGVS